MNDICRPDTEQEILANNVEFHRILRGAYDAFAAGQAEAAAAAAQSAAHFAWDHSTGYMASRELEDLVTAIGGSLLPPESTQPEPLKRCTGLRVLHVLTQAYTIGGHTRLAWRWIGRDRDNTHSVVLTQQGHMETPDELSAAAIHGGGTLTHFDLPPGNLLERARRLRTLVRDYDMVVLHTHPHDVVPSIAFATLPLTVPVIFLNHISYVFWVGVSISNLVLNLCQTSIEFCVERRGIARDNCTAYLPIPIDPPEPRFTRETIRQYFGIPDDAVLLFSSGGGHKYKPVDGIDLRDFVRPVLAARPNAYLLIAGPATDDRWAELERSAPGRVRLLGRIDTVTHDSICHAADIFLDSLPLGSGTSLLEAASLGCPVLTFASPEWKAANISFEVDFIPASLHFAGSLGEYVDRLLALTADASIRRIQGNAVGAIVRRICCSPRWLDMLHDAYRQAAQNCRQAPTGHGLFIKIAHTDLFWRRLWAASGIGSAHLAPLTGDSAAAVTLLETPPLPTQMSPSQEAEKDRSSYAIAHKLIDSGRENEGIAALLALARTGTGPWEIYRDLGVYAERSGDRAAAIELFRHALALEPAAAIASISLARLLIDEGQTDAAASVLEQHLATHPGDAEARALRDRTAAPRKPAPGLIGDRDAGLPASVVVTIPIYRKTPTPFEVFDLDQSLSLLQNRDVLFVGPETLDTGFYAARYPGVPFVGLDPRYFASLEGYNELLLSTAFYDAFANYEFMLVLQTDAILLRDELDYWCAQAFDFIGAPWPNGGFSMTIDMARFAGGNAKTVITAVGNGGLSLRRVARCSALLREFADVVPWFNDSESSEDIFFSFVGLQSTNFSLPDELTASRFSLEFTPSTFFQRNGGQLPMGAHQWWQQAPEFWQPLLTDMPPVVQTMLAQRADFYRLPGDVLVAAPLSMEQITPYVLREQGDWFEDEIRFVRDLLKPGQRAIDIGANFGVFTLSIARAVGSEGHVWAFEPASSTAAMLATSIEANGFDNVTLLKCAVSNENGTARLSLNECPEINAIVAGPADGAASEEVPLVTLDHCLAQFGWQDIDFVKIDAEGQESNVLRGGGEFFARCSPLIQYEIKDAASYHYDLVHSFARLGYASYRLIPGLGLLAPFEETWQDTGLLNLFACKAGHAANLSAHNHLVDAESAASGQFAALLQTLHADLADGGKYHWRRALASLPYAAELAAEWENTATHPGVLELVEALALYACSQDKDRPASERFLALRAAFEGLEQLCERDPSHLRLVTFARVANEFGARIKAINALSRLLGKIGTLSAQDLFEPFLPAGQRFDAIPAEGRYPEWIGGGVLEQQERISEYSSFYNPRTSAARLELIIQCGFASDEMHRRANLTRLRLGTMAG